MDNTELTVYQHFNFFPLSVSLGSVWPYNAIKTYKIARNFKAVLCYEKQYLYKQFVAQY